MKASSVLLLVLSLFLLTFRVDTYAQKSKKVRQLENKRKTLHEEINKISDLIKEADKSKTINLKKLDLLNQQIKARKAVIETLSVEIDEASQEVGRMQVELDSLSSEYKGKQSAYVKSLRAMQTRDNAEEHLLFVLSAKDFAHGLRRLSYLQDYAKWQKEEALRLKSIHRKIEDKRSEVERQTQAKTLLLNQREQEQEDLQRSTEESKKEISKINQQQRELKSQLDKKKKQADALNREIEQQIAKEVAAAAERARKAQAKARTKTTTTKKKDKTTTKPQRTKTTAPQQYEMDSDEVKLSGSFQNNKGRLPMPITGRCSIVGVFGEHSHESLSYVRVNNNGIDIQGQSGAEARAVFEGVVTRIFVVDGYNNSIIIRHGNYLTVYSNLTSVYVRSGDKVKAGQLLGKVFTDPDLRGATLLHFQIWKERTKLNPQHWIKR